MNSVDRLLSAAGLKPRHTKNNNVRTRILTIGPKEAAALLAANIDNRKVRHGRVKYYASVMKEGGWRLTHQGIAFCKDGRALDLQHRMLAIIESGVEIDLMVTEGLSPEAFEAIDQHERRSAADALRQDKKLIEVAKMFLSIAGGGLRLNPTILQLGEVAAIIEDAHAALVKACPTTRKLYSSAPMRAAAVMLMLERPDKSEQIIETYRNLVLAHSELWTPVMHSFNRQINTNISNSGSSAVRIDIVARGLVVLNPDKSDLSKVQIKDSAIADLRARTLAILDFDDAEEKEELAKLPIKSLTEQQKHELAWLAKDSLISQRATREAAQKQESTCKK